MTRYVTYILSSLTRRFLLVKEEILGTTVGKVMPELIRIPLDAPPVLRYLFPQPGDVRVSPVCTIAPYYLARNGSYIHTQASMQLFYSEYGEPSFMVIGIEEHCCTFSYEEPFPPVLYADAPSALSRIQTNKTGPLPT
jgi:hypothetical protein